MKKINVSSSYLLGILFSMLAPASALAATSLTLEVTNQKKSYTFQGFGASMELADLMMPSASDATKTNEIFNLIFSNLQLSYIRLNLEPDFQQTSTSPYNMGWAYETHGQKRIVDAARSRTNNKIKIMYSVWTPPAWMKQNGTLNGGGANYLRTDKVEAFSQYLAEYCNTFYYWYGYPIDYLSIQNEPNYDDSSYSTCTYTPSSYSSTLVRAKAWLDSYGISGKTSLVAPETGWADKSWYHTVLTNVSSSFNYGSEHSYFSSMGWFDSPDITAKPMMQTEFSLSDGSDSAHSAALLVNQFGKDVTDGQCMAWFWFQLVVPQDWNNQQGLIQTNGITSSSNPAFSSYTILKKYYAFQQMTKTVSPGSTIRWVAGPNGDIQACGFKTSAGKFGIILANQSSVTYNLQLKFDELSTSGYTTFSANKTDANNNNTNVGQQWFNNGLFNVTVLPDTVYSFIQQ